MEYYIVTEQSKNMKSAVMSIEKTFDMIADFT